MARGLTVKGNRHSGDSQPMKLPGVKAIAFDLDGTLCAYGVTIQEAIARALRRVGRPIDLVGDLDEAALRYNQLWFEIELKPTSVMFLREQIWERLLSEHEVEEPGLARKLAEQYTQIRVPSIHLFDGVRELLRDLGRIYRLGLLTNGPSDMQWPKIEQLGLRSLFETILVSGDVGFHKPDKAIFDALLNKLGVTAKEALYVGNSHEIDVVGAKSAGMLSAWIRDGNDEDTGNVTPDIVLSNLCALREVLL